MEGRRVFLFVPEASNAKERFALSLNGEPVAAGTITVHKAEIASGINLIRNGNFENAAMPWRIVDGAPARFGRNHSANWHLQDGFTGYLAVRADQTAGLEYILENGDNCIPIAENQNYRFEGYFGRHRCLASVEVELLDAQKNAVTTLYEAIPRKSGGRRLADYAKVHIDIAAPSKCVFARLRLSIKQHASSKGREDEGAYLFFSLLSFGLVADCADRPEFKGLSSSQAGELARAAAIVEITLPKVAGCVQEERAEFEIHDILAGGPAKGSPVALTAAADVHFRSSSFDGVTLAGMLTGANTCESVELLIDQAAAIRQELKAVAGSEDRQLNLRVPQQFLDGAPHILELRESASGKVLFLNAAMTKSLIPQWETSIDFSEALISPELHPLARRRYQNLVAHLVESQDVGLVNTPGTPCAGEQLGRCHLILSQSAKHQGYIAKLSVPPQPEPEVTLILYATDLRSAYRTIAALMISYNNTRQEALIATDDSAENVASFLTFVSGAN